MRTSEIGTNVSLHQIETVPQITRNFLEFADTVPGMVFTVDSNGNTSLRGGGMNNSSVNVYIDGVGQKNYVKEGGVTGQIGTQGNPFPQLAIGEYKVITSNYKAEYDQISSAADDRGDEVRHERFPWRSVRQLHGRPVPQLDACGNRGRQEGAIARERIRLRDRRADHPGLDALLLQLRGQELRHSRSTSRRNIPAATPHLPANVQAQLGPTSLPFKEDLYFGKIDWEFSDRDRIELSSQGAQGKSGSAATAVPTRRRPAIDTMNNDTRIDLRWQHSADNWFNELLFTWEKAFNAPVAFSVGNGQVYTWGPNNGNNDHDPRRPARQLRWRRRTRARKVPVSRTI